MSTWKERRDKRLARARGYQYAALVGGRGILHTEHKIARGQVASTLRGLGYESMVIRNRGWWELWIGGGDPVGSATYKNGTLHVYAPAPDDSAKPPEPPRKADPRYRRVTVSRSVWAWDRYLAALGVKRRQDEGVNEALHRADRALDKKLTERFRGLVK